MKYSIQPPKSSLFSPRRWSFITVGIVSTVLAVSTILLIWTDTYSVLDTKRTTFYDEPNRNFLKVEHILANPKRYDGLIFGSSRVGAILPSHVKGAHFYNMTYSEGIPHEHLLNLRLFLHRGIKIKKILLGLDEFSYQVSFEQHQQRWLTRAHPSASHASWIDFYRFYFFRLPTQHDKQQFKKKLFAPDILMKVDLVNQDAFYRQYLKPLPNLSHNNPIYLKPTLYHGNTLESTLNDIRQIVQLCSDNNIELIVFLNPIHHTTYAYTDHILLNKFKQKLSSITPYYDFSGPNWITRDNRNYVDTSHYTIGIGDWILQTMDQFKPTDLKKSLQ